MTLPLITSLARAGALEQAWRLFREGGYEQQISDPAALAVRGRLLKDGGLRLADEARRLKLAEAAAAYAAADAIDAQPWLAINVATLRLLSGDTDGAMAMAREVLDRLAAPGDIAETRYWLAATRAEALLILGNREDAALALAEARAASPDNHPDQASTVRQLGLILDARGEGRAWLDPHRPPRTLHFAGHLGVAEDAPGLSHQIGEWIDAQGIGAGYGALAAGADIQIAEALLARGAELHAILPVRRDAFLAQSVAPYGDAWINRFHACVAQATTIREATGVSGDYEPLATSLAADMAMGHAALQARLWETEALQLLIIDTGSGPVGQGAATARDGVIWKGCGRSQHLIRWPRETDVAPSRHKREGRPDRTLAALVSIRITGLDLLDEGGFARQLDAWVGDFWKRLRTLDPAPASYQPCGNGRMFAFETPGAALRFIRAVQGLAVPLAFPVSIAAHYALLHRLSGALAGPGLPRLEAMADAALPGTAVLSGTIATALALDPASPMLEPMGEVDGDPLYALV
jgi:hypothetical protein